MDFSAIRDGESAVSDCNAIDKDKIEKIKEQMPEEDTLHTLSDLYKMFADATRLRILWALCRDRMCVCDIAVLLNMTKSAVSHQLKALRGADLVRCDRKGKMVVYSITDVRITKLFDDGMDLMRNIFMRYAHDLAIRS